MTRSTQLTIVVTGSASGIGQSTASLIAARGSRVIGVDLMNADVEADLSTETGRTRMATDVAALAPHGIDGIVANAGTNRPEPDAIRVNYFGAVATLERLRNQLRPRTARAVVVASRALLQEVDAGVLDACLRGDESRAAALAAELTEFDPGKLYPTSKRAIALWARAAAVSGDWAGAGIPLNVVAPGSVVTPMIAGRTEEDQASRLRQRPMPLGGVAEPGEVAAVIGWLLSQENTKVTGQVLFVDGGGEALIRSHDIWQEAPGHP